MQLKPWENAVRVVEVAAGEPLGGGAGDESVLADGATEVDVGDLNRRNGSDRGFGGRKRTGTVVFDGEITAVLLGGREVVDEAAEQGVVEERGERRGERRERGVHELEEVAGAVRALDRG